MTTQTAETEAINYKAELVRKLIHTVSLSIPIIYYFITTELAIILLSIALFIALVLDAGRFVSPAIRKFLFQIFGPLLRKHETDDSKRTLNGATWVLMSALLCVILFPKPVFIPAFTVLIIGDSFAALIGRKFGKHKFLAKSLEGSLAFLVTGSIAILFTPKVTGQPIEYVICAAGVLVAMFAENLSFGWADDNLTIPLFGGAAMWLLYALLLPEVQLILTEVPR